MKHEFRKYPVRYLIVAFILILPFGCVRAIPKTEVPPAAVIQTDSDQKPEPIQLPAPSAPDSPVWINQEPEPCDESDLEPNVTIAVEATDPAETEESAQQKVDEALELCQAAQEFWQKGEFENAIQALDQAYALILTIDNGDDIKLMQQKEDLRFLISKRTLEIYASRYRVATGNYDVIPLLLNDHVKAEIRSFTEGREKGFFTSSLRRSGRYRAKIVEALQEAGLPEELSWLPLIESGFKVRALSTARALGLWQFIPSTGYKFGLSRNTFIDERMDPAKATAAAIAYLKELHQIFGDWATVLAGYNCGEGRVLRTIRSQNVNYLDNFWDLYERLPRETARYVPRFIATLHIINNLEQYGLDTIELDPPEAFEIITISRQVHLKDIARLIDVNDEDLRELNPELRHRILPPENYQLKVPPQHREKLLAVLDQLPVSSPPQPEYIFHRVRPRETLSTIAQRYHTSVRNIARANRISRTNYIVAGKILKIPQQRVGGRSSSTRPLAIPRNGIHVVGRGDSLWIIARNYGTNVKSLVALNALDSTNLRIGQKLKIPSAGLVNDPDSSLKTYIVKPGDSPYLIAKRHNMHLNRLLQLNRLTTRSRIYPNQKLYVE